MAQEFIGGIQAARQQALGTLQMEEAVTAISSRRKQQEKAGRIQKALGEYGAPGADQPAIETQLLGEAPDLAQQLRTFRTSQEAELADRLGEIAAVVAPAMGTEEEPQALFWLAQEAEKLGVPRETVKQNVEAAIQNPEGGRNAVQLMIARGLGAKEYLAQYDTSKQVAKEEREEAGKTRLEGLKQEGRIELETLKQTGKKPPIREQKITDTMTDYGVSEKEARDIVDGRIKISTDPLTGQTRLTNIASGEQTTVMALTPEAVEVAPVVVEPEIDEEPTAEPPQTVFDLLGEDVGVGVGAVIREGLATTAGQVFEGQRYTETTKARTKIKGLREKLIRALSLSGRPPVVEQERLVEMLPSTGIFESAGHATDQLTELHSLLSRQMIDDMAVFNDASMPKKMRGEAAERARGIGGMLRELGTPPPAPSAAQSINTQEEYDALPSGAEYMDTETGQKGRKP